MRTTGLRLLFFCFSFVSNLSLAQSIDLEFETDQKEYDTCEQVLGETSFSPRKQAVVGLGIIRLHALATITASSLSRISCSPSDSALKNLHRVELVSGLVYILSNLASLWPLSSTLAWEENGLFYKFSIPNIVGTSLTIFEVGYIVLSSQGKNQIADLRRHWRVHLPPVIITTVADFFSAVYLICAET